MSAPVRDAACVLASGGVESAVLLAGARSRWRRVHPVYVKAGLRWEAAELHWLRRYLRALDAERPGRLAPLKILRLDLAGIYGRHWSTAGPVPGGRSPDEAVYLPGRNIALFSAAACHAAATGAAAVEIGVLNGNPFPDSSPAFLRKMSAALSEGLGRRLRLAAPLASMKKPDVVRRGARLPLELTFSCIRPRDLRPCGACNKCAEREKAFRAAGRSL
ncbi:MAG TPA: 7-cyano-7-deazaguanine synthase [Candidatus Eisenbacteria bacterium]|nr:7-cyano-7-deazaguanine synthase [Candidatus Eisenbacteria bacterium]